MLRLFGHRDLTKVLPSTASLIQHFRAIFAAEVDNNINGQFCVETFEFWFKRGEAARAKYPDRFYDLYYDDLVKDPIGAMKKLYNRFDLPYTSESESAQLKLLKQKPKGKHGEHRYSPEQFGLTNEGIRSRFQKYYQKYLSGKGSKSA